MGRKHEDKRRNIDGQQIYVKMFNITDHRGNANQNYNALSLTPIRIATIKEKRERQRDQKNRK